MPSTLAPLAKLLAKVKTHWQEAGLQSGPKTVKTQVSSYDLGVVDGCAARDLNPEPAD
jgi:hypothetical protein